MCYSSRVAVELVQNEGWDLEDFSDVFIFIIGIRATSRIFFIFFYCVWIVPALLLRQRKVCGVTLWIIYLTSTHPKLSKNVYMFILFFLVVYLLQFFLNGQKQYVDRSRERHSVAS